MSHAILIVDDSATVRQQLRILLEAGGYDVREAINGQAALDVADRVRYSLVISDVNMPVMNGLDLIRALRAKPAFARIPIFVLTTESSVGVARQGKEAGATAWIVKPFKPELLLKGIQKVLGG